MNSATGMSVTMAGADGWTTEVAAADLDPQPPDKLKFTGASLGSRLSPDGRWLSDGRGHTYENGLPASRSQSILRKQFKVEQPELTTSLYSLASVRINVVAQVEWLFSCTDVPMLGAEGSVLRHDGTKQPSPMLAWAHDGIATSGYGWRLGAEGPTSKSESLVLGPLRFTPLRLAGLDVGGSDSGQPWLQRLQVDGSLQVSEGLGRGEASAQLARLTFTRLSADAPLALHPIIERISADGKSINASWHWTCSLGLSCRPDDVDRTAQIRLGMAAAESLLTGGTAGLELEFEWLGQPVVLQLQARDAALSCRGRLGRIPKDLISDEVRKLAALNDAALLSPKDPNSFCAEELAVRAAVLKNPKNEACSLVGTGGVTWNPRAAELSCKLLTDPKSDAKTKARQAYRDAAAGAEQLVTDVRAAYNLLDRVGPIWKVSGNIWYEPSEPPKFKGEPDKDKVCPTDPPKEKEGCKYDSGFRWFKALSSVAGWLITALMISFGAPFWFDLLSKLVDRRGRNLRRQQHALIVGIALALIAPVVCANANDESCKGDEPIKLANLKAIKEGKDARVGDEKYRSMLKALKDCKLSHVEIYRPVDDVEKSKKVIELNPYPGDGIYIVPNR
ncbi:hypothetical protein DAPPUDRAFT_273763, partial [Daphnia pulex]